MLTRQSGRSRRRWGLAVTTIVAVAAMAACDPPPDPPPPTPDGLSSQTAAASCWEVKQLQPSSADGVYWLNTPALGAPEQFYCDMTTDGGGWVLLGRGREGWAWHYGGQGTPNEVRDIVDGTGAFPVRTLPAKTVDGLLNNAAVNTLTDAIRVRRATTTDGTGRQEIRFRMPNLTSWVWTHGGEHRVGNWNIGGQTGTGGLTYSFGSGDGIRRVDNRDGTLADYVPAGWSYGSQIAGSSSPGSYLWSPSTGQGTARPFAQVFLRPRLMSSDLSWSRVPDGGIPGQSRTPLLANGVEPTVWGVTGLANGSTGELDTEVQTFAQIGTRVYVGGNLRYVQRNSSGLDQVEQPYLAAFDVNTRQWVSSFRPQLNGQVKDLASLPSGKLIVGGEFTQVNGQTQVGAVALDPATGATDPTWTLDVENRLTGGYVSVRALDVQGPWLYLGGAFTHMTGGSRPSAVFARSGARVATADGTPDADWNPNFNGTVVDVDTSAQGDRTYMSGYFTESNGLTSNKAAVVSTAAGAPLVIEWSPHHSHPIKQYQQAVLEAGNRVWLGGAQHRVASFDRSNFEILSSNITIHGGDFQVIEDGGDGMVYASCHCNDFTYSEAYEWPSIGSNWTRADKIGFIGAWNQETGALDPEFSPRLNAREGAGAWAIFRDSTGTVWAGGDFVGGFGTSGNGQWVGGFVRFRPRDTTQPTTPSGLTSSPSAPDTSRLTWTGSSDNSGSVSYQVLRNDRVVATTTATQLDVPTPTQATRYFVRAIDATDNYSATTTVHSVPPAA